MVKGELVKRISAITISVLLVALIFFILVPPATAVYLYPGTPSPTSVNTGATITFSNVNLTIRGYEKIPVNYLIFKVFNNANDQQVAYVKFYINGTEIEDYPSGKFTVTNTTMIGDNWYEYGYQNGTDEYDNSEHDFGYGYGYGYGESGYTDITSLYTITYKTHTTGTFYARLFVNSTSDTHSHTYESIKSTRFTVSTPSGPSGPSGPDEEEEEEEEPVTTKEQIENWFNIELEYNFSASDTDDDGINDTFTDPNGVLQNELDNSILINGNASFLVSVNGDLNKLFIWDTETDEIINVTHSIGTITDTVADTENNTITVTTTVNKDKWIYIEVTDKYPDISDLTVMTSDGRTISSDKIKRENDKIYILDDPAVEYLLIYSYEEEFLFDVILELTTDSVYTGESINALITLINVGEPGLVNGTVVYTLYKEDELIWSDEENVSVLTQKAYNKTILTDELSPGSYTYKVVYSYGDDQTASSSVTFTVNARPPSEGIPLWVIIALMVVIIFVLILVVLFKTGRLYLEKEGGVDKDLEKANKEVERLDGKIKELDENYKK